MINQQSILILVIISLILIVVVFYDMSEPFVPANSCITDDNILIINGARPVKNDSMVDMNGNIIYNPNSTYYKTQLVLKKKKKVTVKNPNDSGIPWNYDDMTGVIPTDKNYDLSTSDIIYGKNWSGWDN